MQQKKKKGKIITSIICLFLAVVLSLTGAYALSVINNYNYVALNASDNELGIAEDNQNNNKEITNIALFGVDTRSEKYVGNSDSLMILSIDKQHNKIKLISILRDSLVNIPGHGKSKITEAYSYGGAKLAIQTLNTNYKLNIRDYATINFSGMAKIIDAVGGVDIQIEENEIDMLNGLAEQQAQLTKSTPPAKVTKAGNQTLNGLQAVAYSRIRKVNNSNGSYGDFGRTDRQRTIMEKLFEKALKLNPLQYPSLLQSLLPSLETSLGINEILNLASILSKSNLGFEQTRVPLQEYTVNPDYNYNGKSMVYYNLNYAADIIHAFIYDETPSQDYIAAHSPPTTVS